MKTHLESSLDKAAEEREWGAHWKSYRAKQKTLQEIIEHLPTFAKIQFEQIAGLYNLIYASRQEVKDLTKEVKESYQAGLRDGLAASYKADLFRHKMNGAAFIDYIGIPQEALKNIKSKEYHRSISLQRAKTTWMELF